LPSRCQPTSRTTRRAGRPKDVPDAELYVLVTMIHEHLDVAKQAADRLDGRATASD